MNAGHPIKSKQKLFMAFAKKHPDADLLGVWDCHSDTLSGRIINSSTKVKGAVAIDLHTVRFFSFLSILFYFILFYSIDIGFDACVRSH